MTAELITQTDLGIMLSMGKDAAREFCSRHGVQPINVGLGKVARLRWNRSEVMQLIGTLQAKGKQQEFVRRKKTGKTVLGKSVAELMRELSPLQ